MNENLSVVGKRLPRPDAAEKATGAALYTADMKMPGMLVGKILRSPYAHANIVRVDTSEAEKLAGVEAIITFEDIPKHLFNAGKAGLISKYPRAQEEPEDQYVLCDKARFIGDAIAAVAAVNEAVAEEALSAIRVEYEELPAVFDPIETMKPGAPLIHDFADGNVAWRQPYPFPKGDVAKGFQEADVIIEETFTTSRQKHGQLETSACIASFAPNGRLTIWSPDQEPHTARNKIARLFDMPVGMVRWITPTVGGAFGNGLSFRGEPICVALAKKTGKAVKIEYTAEEQSIASETRQPFIATGKMGVKKNGAITAMQINLLVDAGAYFTLSAHVSAVNVGFFLAKYRCANITGHAEIVYTNTLPAGGMRGYGNAEGTFALEQLIDIAAEKIGMDPIEFRLKNSKGAGEPGRSPSLPIESCALEECIRTGMERIGWSGKKGKGEKGIKKRGVGMATMMHGSSAHPGLLEHSNAFIKLNEDGSANLVVGACEIGQGVLAVLTQIAAEELGLRPEDVHILTGDTDVTMFNIGTHASRSTYVLGNTVQRAAAQVKKQLLERAAGLLGTSEDALGAEGGRIYCKTNPEHGVSIAQIAQDAIYHPKGECLNISGTCSWEPTQNPPSYQAAFAEVEVNTQTGRIEVLKMVLAHDIGRVINPLGAEGQLESGIAQGIGYCLTEDTVINKQTGAVESDSFETYRILTSMDIPETDVVFIEQPTATGPFGAKSLGEGAMCAVAPAIANAIYDAVGVRMRDLPVTPEQVLAGLGGK